MATMNVPSKLTDKLSCEVRTDLRGKEIARVDEFYTPIPLKHLDSFQTESS
jgi:hypothetical protein